MALTDHLKEGHRPSRGSWIDDETVEATGDATPLYDFTASAIWCLLNRNIEMALEMFRAMRFNLHPRGNARAVVQLGRTLAWGARGREFESRQPDHFILKHSPPIKAPQ